MFKPDIQAIIENNLAKIVPEGIFAAVSSELSLQDLSSSELTYVNSIKNNNRKDHFIKGRIAAKNAYEKLTGLVQEKNNLSLEKLDSGLVKWPDGIVGSISHSSQLAVAIVAKEIIFQSIGIDIEFYREIQQEIEKRIGSKDEYDLLAASNISPEHSLFVLFSAKESIYKTLFPLSHKAFAWLDLILEFVEPLDINNRSYILRFSLQTNLSSKLVSGTKFDVKAVVGDTFSLTLCTLPVLV